MQKAAKHSCERTYPISLRPRVERLLSTIFFLFAFYLAVTPSVAADQYKIVRVVDGDTIVINYQRNQEKIRLLCVNTPESVHPDKKQNIPMGKIASDYTKKRLKGKYVDLEFDGPFRGRYGRLLAYVIVDGQNFNIELVREGLSPYYTKYGLSQRYDKDFLEAEEYARTYELNIWENPELSRKYLGLKYKWPSSRLLRNVDQQKNINIQTGTYVGNNRSHKFHRPGCRWAKKISQQNMVYFKSRQKAIGQGYIPCKACNP